MLLSRNIPVIPVLVSGAAMPRVADLPEDIWALAKRQGRELRDTAWDSDVAALIQRLKEEIVEPRPLDRSKSVASRSGFPAKLIAAGAVIVLVAVIWILLSSPGNTPTELRCGPRSRNTANVTRGNRGCNGKSCLRF